MVRNLTAPILNPYEVVYYPSYNNNPDKNSGFRRPTNRFGNSQPHVKHQFNQSYQKSRDYLQETETNLPKNQSEEKKINFFFTPGSASLINTLKASLEKKVPINSYRSREYGTVNNRMLSDILQLATKGPEEIFRSGNNNLEAVFSTGITNVSDVTGNKYSQIAYPDQFSGLATTKINNDFIVQSLQQEKLYYEQLYTFITNTSTEGISSLIKEFYPYINENDLKKLSGELFTAIQEKGRLLSSNIQVFNKRVDQIQVYLNSSSELNKAQVGNRRKKFSEIAQGFGNQGA